MGGLVDVWIGRWVDWLMGRLDRLMGRLQKPKFSALVNSYIENKMSKKTPRQAPAQDKF